MSLPNAAFSTLAVLCLASLAPLAQAQTSRADNMGVYIQAGHTSFHHDGTNDVFIGVTGPWLPPRAWGGGAMSVYWDAYLGQWHGHPASGGTQTLTQIGLVPTARFRFSEGNSPLFAEFGLGVTYLDGLYAAQDRSFSTRFNFTERLGVGMNFGSQREHEVSVSYQHFSNAGIKKPNPGEDWVQLRYAYKF